MYSQQELSRRFTIADYAVFVSMLLVSAAIGVYYACTGNKQSTTKEFLFGGKSMQVLPVALSVLATFVSAITLLGVPAETYQFGIQYWMINISYCFMIPVIAYLYIPVFYNLQVCSINEYLEKRFNRFIRTVAFAVSTISSLVYMAFVVYAPSLVLSQVITAANFIAIDGLDHAHLPFTGLHLWLCVSSIGVVCTFYTTIGGIKAVVWTDVFQTLVIFGALFTVVIKGVISAGGIETVWAKAENTSRTEFFNIDPDPTIRHSFWTLTFGGFFTWLSIYAVNQAMVQRALTIPTLRGATTAVWLNLPGNLLTVTVTCLAGLVIFANYSTCDPIKTKQVTTPNQILPLFVMDTLGLLPGMPGLFVSGIFSGALSAVWLNLPGNLLTVTVTCLAGLVIFANYSTCDPIKTKQVTTPNQILPLFVMDTLGLLPGMPGLFVSGIFSGALSSLSSTLNSLSAVTLEDIVRIYIAPNMTDAVATKTAKSLAFAYGIIAILLVFIVENLTGTVLQAALSISGTFGGPLLGIFTLGMFFPWPNNVGAFIGFLSGLAVSLWICIGSILNKRPFKTAPFSVQSCEELYFNVTKNTVNVTQVFENSHIPSDDVFVLYRLSYLWYSTVGCLIVIIVGLLSSLITGNKDKCAIDPSLISPFFRKLWKCNKKDPSPRLQEMEINTIVGTSTSIQEDRTNDQILQPYAIQKNYTIYPNLDVPGIYKKVY